MKKNIILSCALLSLMITACDSTQTNKTDSGAVASADGSDHYSTLAELPFPNNQPSQESADALHEELAFQRAVQSYLWALPAMNMYAMREGQRNTFGDASNILMIAKDRIDHNFTYSTGNPDVIYAFACLPLMPFVIIIFFQNELP